MKLRFKWSILIPVIILSVFSLISIYSIDQDFFRDHLINIILGVIVFIFVSQINLKPFASSYNIIYFISLILLLLLFVVGDSQRGAVRWYNIFGLSIQISEILKPLLLISLAGYLANNKKNLKTFITVLISAGIIFALVASQPDLGTGLVFLSTTLGVLMFTGFPLIYFAGLIIAFVISTPVWYQLLRGYQIDRLLTFLDPSRDPLGTTYNVTQAVIAVGSGLILGKGFFQNTQSSLRFLPEKHTDFIFAGISETFGLIGAGLIICSFVYLLYNLIIISRESKDDFVKIFITGSFILLSIHVTFNIGMNLGLLPVVGLTLPFVSYGGSSIIASFLLLGMVSSLSSSDKIDYLEIK